MSEPTLNVDDLDHILPSSDAPEDAADDMMVILNYGQVLFQELSELVNVPDPIPNNLTEKEFVSNKAEEYCRKIFASSQIALSIAAQNTGLSIDEFAGYVQFRMSKYTSEYLEAKADTYLGQALDDIYADPHNAEGGMIAWKVSVARDENDDTSSVKTDSYEGGISAGFFAGMALATAFFVPYMGEAWSGFWEYFNGE